VIEYIVLVTIFILENKREKEKRRKGEKEGAGHKEYSWTTKEYSWTKINVGFPRLE
jgi:hypothetical protein